MNINNLKKHLTINSISFLADSNLKFNICECTYHTIFMMDHKNIKNFIRGLNNDKIFIVSPFISINCKTNDPYVNLSRQFLITNESNYNLIYDYLFNQSETFFNDFEIDEDNINYNIIFKLIYITPLN